jgi:hypothetical protein
MRHFAVAWRPPMLHGSAPRPIPHWVSTRIDDEAIEYYRSVGGFIPAEDREPLTVELVQRDDLAPDGDPAELRHNPAQVRIAGIRLSPDEAVRLARLLHSAVTMTTPTDRPQRLLRSYNGGYGLAPVSAATQPNPQQRRSA